LQIKLVGFTFAKIFLKMSFTNLPISVLAFVRKYENLSSNIRYHLVRRDLLLRKFQDIQLENGRLMLIDNSKNLELAKNLEEAKKGPKFKNLD